jgi:hypothetical protein
MAAEAVLLAPFSLDQESLCRAGMIRKNRDPAHFCLLPAGRSGKFSGQPNPLKVKHSRGILQASS